MSCNGSLKKPNSTVILNFRTRLIKNYVSKGFYIIERGTKQLSLIPNDVRLRIILNNQLDKDFFMAKKQSDFWRSKHYQNIIYSERYANDLQTRLI